MSAFTGALVIEEVVPGRRWRLVEPLRYEAGAKGSGQVIEVPAGFETDGATIPTALRVLLAVWGTYGRAACIHDYLYWLMRERMVPAGLDIWPSDCKAAEMRRAWADAEFHTAMIACGTSRPLAFIIWASVRLFGGSAAVARSGRSC